MASLPPISTPLSRRIRQLRCRLLPLVTFLGSGMLAGWLWERHHLMPSATGEVFAAQADAIGPVAGILKPHYSERFELLDSVSAGQVVARLDDRPTQAALATLQAELARVHSELEAASGQVRQEQEDRQHDRRVEARRLIVQIEMLRLDILDREAEIAKNRVEWQRLDEAFQILRKLMERNVATSFQVAQARLLRDAVDQIIQKGQVALKEAKAQLTVSLERVETYESIRATELAKYEPEKYLAPARAAIATQEAKIRELNLQIEALEIRSPMSGQIVAISRRPGQVVQAGDSILTIASHESRYIVGYLRQEQRIRPSVGMVVDIRSLTAPVRAFRSRVEHVGPQVLPVPVHQVRDPKILERGLPVRIPLPADSDLRPGELVNLTFRRVPTPG